MHLHKFNVNTKVLCSSPESLLILEQYLFHARILLNEESKPDVLPDESHQFKSAHQMNTSLLSQPLPNSPLHTGPYTLVALSAPPHLQ